MFKYLKLVPILEKLVSDIEKAEATPENQAIISDVRELIADINTAPKPTA